jgi:peptidoglycan-associated lipoprotein
MFERHEKSIQVATLLGLVVLLGCQAVVDKATEYPRPTWTVENPIASKGSSQGSSQTASRDATREPSASSLDALREGRKGVTPASSPLKDIYFDFDSSELRTDTREALTANAEWLKQNASVRVEIEGHSDDRGTNEYNMALGAKRAQVMRDYLITLGVPANRLSTISFGEEVPVCTEQTDECWGKNRRGRFVIIPVRPAS